MFVIGGKKIKVETTGKTIKISFDENKEEDDPDPQPPTKDPCVHPGDNDNNGGANPDDEEPGESSSSSGGGVSPEDDIMHTGDDGCNCD